MTYTVFIQCCVSGETQADANEVCDEESEQEENDNEKTSKRRERGRRERRGFLVPICIKCTCVHIQIYYSI